MKKTVDWTLIWTFTSMLKKGGFWMRRKENAPTRQQKLIVGDSRDSKEPLSGRVLYILHEYDYLSYKSNMK
jgi:hypothetical protein